MARMGGSAGMPCSVKEMRDIFAFYDADGDGFLDLKGLNGAMRCLGVVLSKPIVDENRRRLAHQKQSGLGDFRVLQDRTLEVLSLEEQTPSQMDLARMLETLRQFDGAVREDCQRFFINPLHQDSRANRAWSHACSNWPADPEAVRQARRAEREREEEKARLEAEADAELDREIEQARRGGRRWSSSNQSPVRRGSSLQQADQKQAQLLRRMSSASSNKQSSSTPTRKHSMYEPADETTRLPASWQSYDGPCVRTHATSLEPKEDGCHYDMFTVQHILAPFSQRAEEEDDNNTVASSGTGGPGGGGGSGSMGPGPPPSSAVAAAAAAENKAPPVVPMVDRHGNLIPGSGGPAAPSGGGPGQSGRNTGGSGALGAVGDEERRRRARDPLTDRELAAVLAFLGLSRNDDVDEAGLMSMLFGKRVSDDVLGALERRLALEAETHAGMSLVHTGKEGYSVPRDPEQVQRNLRFMDRAFRERDDAMSAKQAVRYHALHPRPADRTMGVVPDHRAQGQRPTVDPYDPDNDEWNDAQDALGPSVLPRRKPQPVPQAATPMRGATPEDIAKHSAEMDLLADAMFGAAVTEDLQHTDLFKRHNVRSLSTYLQVAPLQVSSTPDTGGGAAMTTTTSSSVSPVSSSSSSRR